MAPLSLSGSTGISGVDGSAGTPAIQGTDTNTGISFPAADTVAVNTGGSERLRVDSSGRLGIGTASPSSQLHVRDSANYNFTVAAGNATTGMQIGNYEATDGYNPLTFRGSQYLFISTGGNERARIDSSGRLLVGTSSARSSLAPDISPSLQIEGTSYTTSSLSIINNQDSTAPSTLILGKSRGTTLGSNAIIQNGDRVGDIRFIAADGNNLSGRAGSIACEIDGTPGANDLPGRLVFSTTADGASSPTERMRIRNSGEILINQTNTLGVGVPLQVSGAAADWVSYFSNSRSPDPYGIQIHYNAAAPNNTSSEFLYCRDNATLRASIRSNGGLVNFQANNVNLSDRNAKKDIAPAADTWDCIKEWEIVNYRYKDQPDDADLNLGVIAQQVAENCPEVITVFQEAKDDQPEKLGVKEQQMYWMAIKALQEAQVRIEQLEAKVAALEAA